MRWLILILLFGLTTAGCATQAGTGTAVGAGGGALIGGALGGWQGALIGSAIGGVGGYAVGRSMDEQDRIRAAQALEYNQPVEWRGDQGEYYQMTPGQTTYYQGRECRRYQLRGSVDGRPETINGTACRTPNGQWENIST